MIEDTSSNRPGLPQDAPEPREAASKSKGGQALEVGLLLLTP